MASKYIVKSCTSGDTLVLRGRLVQGQAPPERVVHLAEITAPRLGSSQREDEPWAFESREFLRALTVGKEVTFESTYSLPTNDSTPRDVGIVTLNGQDLTVEVLKNGWAKLKENRREATDEDIQRRAIETDARNNARGIWNATAVVERTVYHTMPSDSAGFMNKWKGKPIKSLVELVRDGSNMRVRLMLSNTEHQIVNLSLAGVKSPRVGAREGEASEQFGEEAKFFVESRLLQRLVTVTLLSLPAPPPTSFSNLSSDSAPQSASTFIGIVIHPAGGNIAEPLIAAGLARVVDWHAGMLAASGTMERLRTAEKSAKEKRLKLYGGSSTPTNGSHFTSSSASPAKTLFQGQVVRVWGGDQISVYDPETKKDRRVQLSSVRALRSSDPKLTAYANEAKEFLRKKLIGQTVTVRIDFIRPKEGEFEERECATITLAGQKTTVAEQLIERGLATAVRHRRDDENRSPDYDKLMAAEQSAASGGKGFHSQKELPVPRIVNVSETHAKATQFLPGLKRAGRLPAIVDYVAAGSRFKLLIPKDNQTVTFVLAGIRAPRTARNPAEKSEPYGQESLDFATRHYLQRDVEAQFEAVDKSGGFIGSLWYPKPDKTTENVAVTLVREGLAQVHDYSAEGLSWSKQLYDAQEEAKAASRNMWKDYVEAPEVEATAPETALKTQYMDVIISDIRSSPQFGFSVQVLNNEGIQALERLMREFSNFHKTAKPAPAGYSPKVGDLISARFSGDNGWYRAKVKKSNPVKKECDVVFIDYGNQEVVSLSNIRPLDDKFRSLPGQAQDARLSFVKMLDPSSDYFEDALDRFKSLCEGRKLIANIDAKEGPVLHLRLLEPSDAGSSTDSINATLVREGLCLVDKKGCKYLSAYPAIFKRLLDDTAEAKRSRSGMFEFGDITPEDD